MGLKLVSFGACTILALSISMLIIGFNNHNVAVNHSQDEKKNLTLICSVSEAPLYLLATGSTLTGITILLIVLYFLKRRLDSFGLNSRMPGTV